MKSGKSRNSGRLSVFATGVGITVVSCLLYIFTPGIVRYVDLKLYDVMIRNAASGETTGIPAIVDIDEKSLARFGQWPWPRYRVALLIEKIKRAGAAVIGIDILFAESDRTSPRVLKRDLKKDLNVEIGFSGLPDELMDNDYLLAGILKRSPVVLGYYFDFNRLSMTDSSVSIPALDPVSIKSPGAGNPDAYLLSAEGTIPPLALLLNSSTSAGYLNALPDEDGVLRRAALMMAWNGRIYPGLPIAVLKTASGIEKTALKTTAGGIKSMRIGKTVIPLDRNGRLLINFRGKRGKFKRYSALDVMEDRLPEKSLAGKIVFLGTSFAGLKDLHATPFDPVFPGVEVHATVVDNILKGDFISRPDWAPGLEFCLVLLIGLMTAFFIASAGAAWTIPLVAACFFAVWIGAVNCLSQYRFYISPLFSFVVLAANFSFLNFIKFMIAEKEKRFVRNTFGRYLTDDIVRNILDTPGGLALGGEKKEVTIMMTDLRGFTSIGERLPPEDVVTIINNYLKTMIPLVIKYQGTIDEFIGDAILVIFGAPVSRSDHAVTAVACAVEMQLAMAEVNRLNREKGLPAVEQGIGLNTGEVVIGNIGSEVRSKYGVIGKTVNQTARIESYTVGGQIYISESTRQKAGASLRIDGQMEVKPKGMPKPVTIYDVGGVGGRYDVHLPENASDVPRKRDCPLHVVIIPLEGKHAGDASCEGLLTHAAVKTVVIQSDLHVEPLYNLKIELMDENGVKVSDEIYGKVTDLRDDGSFEVRLTSVPPEAEKIFKNV